MTSSTSNAAHRSIKGAKNDMYARILGLLQQRGDFTCEEIEDRLAMRHQTCSARLTELYAKGRVDRIGKRPTSSGRLAHIYRITSAGTLWLKTA